MPMQEYFQELDESLDGSVNIQVLEYSNKQIKKYSFKIKLGKL